MKKHKKDRRKKSEKKKNRHDSDYSHEDAGKDLDTLLAAKYIKLKEKLHKTNIAKLRRNLSSTSDINASYRNKADDLQEALSSCRKRTNGSDSSGEDRNDCEPARRYGLQVCRANLSQKLIHKYMKHQFNKCNN
jgi:NAD+--asparagine ADP-ribosyltransferase